MAFGALEIWNYYGQELLSFGGLASTRRRRCYDLSRAKRTTTLFFRPGRFLMPADVEFGFNFSPSSC